MWSIETKTNFYGAYLIILVTIKSILKNHLKPGIVSITAFVCHSPYCEASHYLRMYSIPVTQARGIPHFSGVPSPFWDPQALSHLCVSP